MRKLSGALAAALLASSVAQSRKIFGFDNIRRMLQRQKRDYTRGSEGSIATANRWTGQPHRHEREIARHLRQAARS